MEPAPHATGLDRVAHALHLHRDERRPFALLFLQLFLGSALFVLGRTVRDTLLLSRWPISALPWLFVAFGVASGLTVVVYTRVADRLPRAGLFAGTTALASLLYLGTFAGAKLSASFVYPLFWVGSEVVANLLVVQLWTIANELFDARAGRRIFPTVAAARVLAIIVVGLLSGVAVRRLGTEQLLLVLVGIAGAMALVARAISRTALPSSAPVATTRRRSARPPAVLSDGYVRALALFLLLLFASLTIGDYLFKAVARATYQEDALAQFFALFYAGTGGASLLLQLFVTERVLRRFGVGTGVGILPAVFGAAAGALVGLPHLAVATAMKFADNGLQFTLHETSLQSLYGPFAPEIRARTRALLDAVVKPAAYGVGGLVLALLASRVPIGALAALAALGSLGALAAAGLVRARYVRALEQRLGTRGASTAWMLDADQRRLFAKILERGEPRTAIPALEALHQDPGPELKAIIGRLAEHPDPGLRAAALRRLGLVPGTDPALVLPSLRAPDPAVRAAALEALAALDGARSVAQFAAAFDDPDEHVRVVAVGGAIRAGGVAGAMEAVPALTRLMASAERARRIEAARVLGVIGAEAARVLSRLLDDPSPEVRRAALAATTAAPDPDRVPHLLTALLDRSTKDAAAAALAAVGPAAVPALEAALADPATPQRLRLALPRILQRIPHREAVRVLRLHLSDPDGHVRSRVLAALVGLRERLGAPPEPSALVERLVRRELSEAARLAASVMALPEAQRTGLVRVAAELRLRRAAIRALHALALRFDPPALRLARAGLDRPARRSSALEIVDALAPPSIRPELLRLLEASPDVERVAKLYDGPRPAPKEWLIAESAHPNPVFAAIALQAIGRGGAREHEALLRERLSSPEPLVREAALQALRRVAPELAVQEAVRMGQDPDRSVRRSVARSSEGVVHGALERVLLLKSTPLFSKLPVEELAPLARAAEERSARAGETICAEGELGDELFVILHGRVEVFHEGQRLSELGPGEAFGELSVLDAEPRSATVKALEPTELLAIGSDEFYEVLREQGELAEGIIRLLTTRLREANAPRGNGR